LLPSSRSCIFESYFTAQEKYGLPKTCNLNHNGCWNHILTITDSKIYSRKIARKARSQRPDVFLSGALHGNERVGPVAIIEVAKLLVTAASCESGEAPAEVRCGEFYSKYTKREVSWLARLVSTRRIVIVPAANSNGYYYNRREEGGFGDPNRDFAIDQMQSSTDQIISSTCMRTITARTINELFHDHLFQISLTYHAGMESISYAWGERLSPKIHCHRPDHKSQDVVTMGLAQFAGKLYPNRSYVTGDTNSVVYSVRGSFEDWAYAGSWAKQLVNKCNRQTYNGYDLSKTTYHNATLRVCTIIIETSTNKNPGNNALGTDQDLLSGPFPFDVNSGHVAKHIKTSLLAIDVVEPYVEIIQCKKKKFMSELKALVPLRRRWSKKKKFINAKSSNKPRISWTVSGSFQVDETFLVYGLWTDFPNFFNGIQQLEESQLESVLDPLNSAFSITPVQSGGTRWSSYATDFGAEEIFKKKINLSRFSASDEVAVLAFVKVDQAWADTPANI
jgi:hypothetical protein